MSSSAKSVLISGASSGIGQACAMRLAALGFRVFAGVRNPDNLEALCRQSVPGVVWVHLDVKNQATIDELATQLDGLIAEEGLAALVNCAAIVVTGPVEFLEREPWLEQFEVNFFGAIALTRAMLPFLRQGRGRIVNLSSISGRIAPPYFGPYCCSKWALEAVSDVLRVELRKFGISVSVVEPGNTATPLWQKARAKSDELFAGWSRSIPERVPGSVWETYQADIEAMRRATEQAAKSAAPIEPVVAAVCHAICARKPRTRYPVGIRVRTLFWLCRWLPDRWRDRFVIRILGLP